MMDLIIIIIIITGKMCSCDLLRSFPKRYYNHRSGFTLKIYRYRNSLSNCVWEIKKKQGIDPILKWEITKKNAENIRLMIDIVSYVCGEKFSNSFL